MICSFLAQKTGLGHNVGLFYAGDLGVIQAEDSLPIITSTHDNRSSTNAFAHLKPGNVV